MSIIYEALKKLSPRDTELQGSNPPQKSTTLSAALKPRAVFLRIALALGGITIGILAAWLATARLNGPTAAVAHKPMRPAASPNPAASPSQNADASDSLTIGAERQNVQEKLSTYEAPELILNGIVLSADGNLALINEEILKVGDDIREAKVEEITDKQVTLTFQNQEIILKKK